VLGGSRSSCENPLHLPRGHIDYINKKVSKQLDVICKQLTIKKVSKQQEAVRPAVMMAASPVAGRPAAEGHDQPTKW